MKILIFVFAFFMFSALTIISNNDLALIKDSNILVFFELYMEWLDGIYLNVQSLSGFVSKLNWAP